MKEITLSNDFKDIQLIKKGMSGDKKYHITTNKDEHLLLRISDISEFKFAVSAITSIVWAKYFAPDELSSIFTFKRRHFKMV